MRILTTTLLLLIVANLSFGQNEKVIELQPDLFLQHFIKNQGLKSAGDYIDSEPDSVISYIDSNKTEIKKVFRYEFNENIVTKTTLEYNQAKKLLVNSIKHEYYLDKSLTEAKYIDFILGTEVQREADTFRFNTSIGDTLAYEYSWDTINKVWNKLYRTTHDFNSEKIIQKSFNDVWDITQSAWEYNCETHYQYIKGVADSVTPFVINDKAKDTIHSNTFAFHFEANDRLLKVVDPARLFVTTDSLVYNTQGDIKAKYKLYTGVIYVVNRSEFNYDEYNRLSFIHNYERDGEENPFTYHSYEKYFYSTIPVSEVKEHKIGKVESLVYPNPATDIIYLSNYQGLIHIYSVSGNLMSTQLIGDYKPISIGNLEDGLYLIKTDSGISEKFIKY